jgi:hypothetical protein
MGEGALVKRYTTVCAAQPLSTSITAEHGNQQSRVGFCHAGTMQFPRVGDEEEVVCT